MCALSEVDLERCGDCPSPHWPGGQPSCCEHGSGAAKSSRRKCRRASARARREAGASCSVVECWFGTGGVSWRVRRGGAQPPQGPRYSAELLVVLEWTKEALSVQAREAPMPSAPMRTRTAPEPPGPGFPRESPSKNRTTLLRPILGGGSSCGLSVKAYGVSLKTMARASAVPSVQIGAARSASKVVRRQEWWSIAATNASDMRWLASLNECLQRHII